MGVIRLAIIGQYLLWRESLSAFFGRQPDLFVSWTAGTPSQALERQPPESPDVILLHDEFHDDSQFETARRVRRTWQARIVILARIACPVRLRHALDAGITGYFFEKDDPEEIVAGIRCAASGQHCWSPALKARGAADPASNGLAAEKIGALKLTPRQVEILKHVARGASSKQIAQKLHLSTRSVSSHTYRIMRRLDIHDRVELALFAVREGLVAP